MEPTENEIIERYGEQGLYCTPNIFQPNEYEWTCISCGQNVIKIKKLTNIQRKKHMVKKRYFVIV